MYGTARCVLYGVIGSFFLNYDILLTLKIVLFLANSTDPDEMQHDASFYLHLHCLPKYLFRGFQYTKKIIFFKETPTSPWVPFRVTFRPL